MFWINFIIWDTDSVLKDVTRMQTERTEHVNQITILRTQIQEISEKHEQVQRDASRAEMVEAEANDLEDVSPLICSLGLG